MAAGAKEIILNTLAQYGLDKAQDEGGKSLADWAWNRYLETGDADQVMIELRSRPAFKARFPAYDELARQGRALSPAEYVQYESTIYSMLQQYGVPDGIFNTPDTITKMLLNNVSATEASERLAINAEASMTAPPEVRQALQEFYGVTQGDMIAYWLDPDQALPKLRQRYVAAQISGAAAERQFALGQVEAERLSSLGYTYEQARAASENAGQMRGLSEGEQAVSARELLASQLGDVQAQTQVMRAAQSRQARFAGGGGASSQNEGVTGLAPSSST